MTAKTEAQKKASEKWEKKYKQRIIRIAPEKDEQLVALAKKKDTSINALLNTAIDLVLDEDK